MIDRNHIFGILDRYFKDGMKSATALKALKLAGIVQGPAGNYFCFNFDGDLHITKNKIEAFDCRWSEVSRAFSPYLSDEILNAVKYDIAHIPGIFLDDIDIQGSAGGGKGLLDNRNPMIRVIRETNGGGLVNCFLPLEEQEKIIKWLIIKWLIKQTKKI